MTSSSNDTDHGKLTIDMILGLFADEAAEYGEPRAEALARAQSALAGYTERVRADAAAALEDMAEQDGTMNGKFIDIVFDGPPGPIAPRLIEVEDEHGHSIKVGEWVQRNDGYWALRLPVTEHLAVLRADSVPE